MNFVSEKDLLKKREENPEAEEAEPVDNRPLYDRLKEVRDKKQLEWEEEHKLKNQFSVTRGIDEGDADFLSQVDRVKDEQEARKRKEEQELLRMAREQAVIPVQEPQVDRPQRAPKQGTSKQASLVASLVRKRPHSNSSEGESKPVDTATNHSNDLPPIVDEEAPQAKQAVVEVQQQQFPSHCKLIGMLPGMTDYSDSSDDAESSTNSESLDTELPVVAVYAGKGAPKGDGHGGGQQ